MEKITRYAVYYAPPPGGLADRSADWLGWDLAAGAPRMQPKLGIDAGAITLEPRRYGFHGTIRAPFRLADGITPEVLAQAVAGLAARLAPVTMDRLRLEALGRFLALVPQGDEAALMALAAEVVSQLDPLRAPLSPAEIARRRPDSLSSRQRQLLDLWGYPYVMEEFRFHLTLTNRLPVDQIGPVSRILGEYFAPVLPQPFVIGDLCLCGQGEDGQFRLLHRYTLSG